VQKTAWGSWSEPDEDGGSPVTAYVIFRGTVSGEEELLKEIGNITFYDDDDIEGDKTYYYKISAKNDAGLGPHSEGISITSNAEEAGELPLLWIILILVIVIILASAVGAMTMRSKKKKKSQEQAQMTTFEPQPEWDQPAQTFEMEPEPQPVYEPQAFAPTPAPVMTPSQPVQATYKCPSCSRMFTTQNPIQATVVSCPTCFKQTIILPQ
jgi:DNA-directed RNA polymerase subunit RPC12/RpoP